MQAVRELLISAVGLAFLTLIAALHPSVLKLASSPTNYLLALLSAALIMFPTFVLPFIRAFKTLSQRKAFIIIILYWAMFIGYGIYGYMYTSIDPNNNEYMNRLVFGWLLFVWFFGLPIICTIPVIWEKYKPF